MIGRNLETQNILSKLSRDLGEHITGEFTIDQMAALAAQYGREDFYKAINDPEAIDLMDKVAEPGNQVALDNAIISRYFRQHHDMVRAFSNALEDPMRDVAQSYFLKGFYEGAADYAKRGSDIVSSAARMQELSSLREAANTEALNIKLSIKAGITARCGSIAQGSSDIKGLYDNVDAGDLQPVAEVFPDMAVTVANATKKLSVLANKRLLLDKAILTDFQVVSGRNRRDKRIQEWEMGDDSDVASPKSTTVQESAPGEVDEESEKPGKPVQKEFLHPVIPETEEEKGMTREELEEKRQRDRAEGEWRAKGRSVGYTTEEGKEVSGYEIVSHARGFVANEFRKAVGSIEGEMSRLVNTAVENVAKGLVASVDMSKETKAKILKPVTLAKIDFSSIDSKWADPEIQSKAAAKIRNFEQIEGRVTELIDSQDAVLYDFAQKKAAQICHNAKHYDAWANDISREINKAQGGKSFEDLPEAGAVFEGARDKTEDQHMRPSEKAFRTEIMNMRWSPLAKLVIDQLPDKAPAASPSEEMEATEDWPKKHEEYLKKRREAKDKIAAINSESTKISAEMEKLKRWMKSENPSGKTPYATKKAYYKLKLEFNKLMADLVEAFTEFSEYESDVLPYAYTHGLIQGGHSNTAGNPLIHFINTMFRRDIKTLTEAQQYVELLDNGRVVVRASVLKKSFEEFFTSKMTLTIYEAMEPLFRQAVDTKVLLLHEDKVLAEQEADRAKEAEEAEQAKLLEEQTKEEQRQRNLRDKSAPGSKPTEEEVRPDEDALDPERDLRHPEDNAYGQGLSFGHGLPTEEQE